MLTPLEIDKTLFQLLRQSELSAHIKGGIYLDGDRPEADAREAVTIKTIATEVATFPQRATTIVNVYTPDAVVRISGREQTVADRHRLDLLTRLILDAIEAEAHPHLELFTATATPMEERALRQHFASLRIEWYVHFDSPEALLR